MHYTHYESVGGDIIFHFNISARVRKVEGGAVEAGFNEIQLQGTTIARVGECFIDGESDVAVEGGDTVGEGLGDGGSLAEEDCEEKDLFAASIRSLLNSFIPSNNGLNQTTASFSGSSYPIDCLLYTSPSPRD